MTKPAPDFDPTKPIILADYEDLPFEEAVAQTALDYYEARRQRDYREHHSRSRIPGNVYVGEVE